MNSTPEPDAEHEIRFTVYVTGYGKKSKLVTDIGWTIAKTLHAKFGDRFRMVNHKSQPIVFDPDTHDWALGDNA